MTEATECKSNISGRSEEECMRELMDDRNALLLLTQDADRPTLFLPETLNKLISTVYSGPTIGDVEAALAMSCSGSTADSGSHGCLRARIALPEKGFNKMEGKFTVRVKCCSNGIADDGYKWRKYGQKFIKNSPYPRSYYRCTNPRCNAKKQVEMSAEDPETLVITYEGLHLHYAFSHLLLPRPSREVPITASTVPAVKRAKVDGKAAPQQATALEISAEFPDARGPRAAAPGEGGCSALQELAEADAASTPPVEGGDVFNTAQSSLDLPEGLADIPQGLLEDVVPGLLRKPCSSSSGASTILSDPSLFSVPSSPLSSSPSSPFSWPLFDDLGILCVPSSPASSSSSAAAFSWPPHGSAFFDMGMLPAGTV